MVWLGATVARLGRDCQWNRYSLLELLAMRAQICPTSNDDHADDHRPAADTWQAVALKDTVSHLEGPLRPVWVQVGIDAGAAVR